MNVEKKQHEQAIEDAAGRLAAGTPLPGAAFDAFAPMPAVKVGQFEIQEFCDAHFEFLQLLDSPLQKLMAVALQQGDVEPSVIKADEQIILKQMARGRHAWNLAYVMTTPIEEVDDLFHSGGLAAVKRAAFSRFGKLKIVALVPVVEAAVEQMSKSWGTRLDQQPAEQATDGEAASSSSPPS